MNPKDTAWKMASIFLKNTNGIEIWKYEKKCNKALILMIKCGVVL